MKYEEDNRKEKDGLKFIPVVRNILMKCVCLLFLL